MVGRTIGKYRFVDTLGRGGMGTVYKAIDETLDREVAIKVLNADVLESEGVKRFRAEAVTLAKLNHPRIAHVYDLARDGDNLLMAMEFVQGDNFEKLISKGGAMPVERAVALTANVLEALQHAHNAGIVHRDLKPANLMLTPSGDVKVMDFGIARVQGAEHLTNSGYMMGTPAYMAPEQVRGDDVDARTDVYAIGVVLYRMVTGQLPFKADTAVAMIQKQLNDQPTPSRQFRADIPEWLEAVLHRALAKNPADRFQSADELRTALLQNASPDQYLATMPPTPTPAPVRIPAASMTATIPTPSSAYPSPSAPYPAPASAPIPAPPPAAVSQTTVTLQKSHLAGFAAVIGLLVVAVGVLALYVMRRGSEPAEPAPAAVATPTTAAPATAPASAPPTTAAPSVAVATPAAPSATATRPAPRPAAPAAPVTTAPPPAAAPVTAAPAPAPAPPAAPPSPTISIPEAPLSFKDVKLVVADGDKVKEYDVAFELKEGRIVALAARNPGVSKSMPYRSLVSATYSRSKHPRWKEGLGVAAAAGVFSAPIFFMKSTKHWLTLQSKDDYFVLHLDKDNVTAVLPALELRTGVSVQRLEGDK